MLRGGLGTPEILLILGVFVLLFGAKKLPELARGSGKALRIFKAETKGLLDEGAENPALDTAPETVAATHREIAEPVSDEH